MKRTSLRLVSALVVVGCMSCWFGKGLASGMPGLPGSEQDPLVSKSYVDNALKMVVVELVAGSRLFGRAGTEIIVRSGSATAMDSPLGGLADVTGGRDVKQGEQIALNHLLVVPRDDGRGIEAVTSLFVMVRGSYSIEP